MANETVITICGNAVDDPELRFTPSGAAVAKFRIASTPRNFNKQTNTWEDGTTLYLTCSAWRDMAEHIAESVTRGTGLIVQGRLKQREYEKDGVKRTVYEIEADDVAVSLKRATAKVTKATRNGGGGGQGGQSSGGGGGWGNSSQTPAADPWASQGGGQPSGYSDRPPF
jgi:single-strand DNA-binding protein